MDKRELVETGSVSEETKKVVDSSLRTDCVKLVEMGDVSVETKGTLHGLEIGFLPRSY
jgi:hypothetical protein